ncbi:MAG: VanZ family protein [Bacteroidetes bacterium]|nr:VanZ family protein [Bacteroidota bacterium]
MNSFLKYNLLSLLWAILILVLCLMPGKDLPSLTIFEYDKIVHFLIYLLLAIMMYYGWRKQNSFLSLHKNTLIKILLITTIYGFAVEIMQELFTADRHFDIFDALANSVGAVAGSLLCLSLKQKLSL